MSIGLDFVRYGAQIIQACPGAAKAAIWEGHAGTGIMWMTLVPVLERVVPAHVMKLDKPHLSPYFILSFTLCLDTRDGWLACKIL